MRLRSLNLTRDSTVNIINDTVYRHQPVQLEPANQQPAEPFISGKEQELPAFDKEGKTPALRVYPNPAKQKVVIEPNEPVGEQDQIMLLNLKGEKIRTREVNLKNGRQRISLEGLSKGFYLLQWISQDKVRATKKLVIQ